MCHRLQLNILVKSHCIRLMINYLCTLGVVYISKVELKPKMLKIIKDT